ncbi:DUF4239 domain-containing protein [Nocardia sp. NBC_00565]|uniref:bestrophin-like domain n=1 Tax=Nocardia sp. NBC_00565 TaxID=2975993 RepID=UPI002E809B1D|nr:DUF4239 domain-containing protein [Nocardia sp. NBC_00565]WUC07733.1 DUF4239 domain-containing protein [Nocardia sp. NBC_00565]
MALVLIVPVVAAILAVVVFVVGDRLRPVSWRQTDDESSGTLVLDLINTLFLAVVAFVVVICWQEYDNAHNHTIAEAKALVDTYTAAHSMPDPEHRQIEGLVRDYTDQVVTEEWSVMREQRRLSASTQDTFDSLRDAVASVPSTDADVADLRTTAMASLDAVAEARQDRALDAGYRVPGFLYVALWCGTVLLLCTAVLSGVEVTRRSVLMTALLGVVVGSTILAIYNLDRPFSGGNVVPKDAFEYALSRYQHIN